MTTTRLQQERTRQQETVRESVQDLDFDAAVLKAIRSMFRFTYRAQGSSALWSETHVVWLGRNTFVHWCLDDAEVDIPWIVSGTNGAPANQAELRKRVRDLGIKFFNRRLSDLSTRSTGSWLPLP